MMVQKKKYYSDVLIAIGLIEDFTSGITSYVDYKKDFKSKSAVERQLITIGEAFVNLKKLESNAFPQAHQVIAFRNRIVHSYDNIDDSIVWTIIKRHLPELKKLQ